MDEANNVISLFPHLTESFDNLICECGSEKFFISVYLKAVCCECYCWMDGNVDLKGSHR